MDSSNSSYKKTILDNGIRVVTETHRWAQTVQLGLFVESGTKHELEGQMGMAHLTEHMVFKGTSSRSALDIVLDVEKHGADINAHTSREYTCYTTASLTESTSICLESLSDLVFKATFPESEFEKEKDVVIQEIDMSKDLLEDYIFDLFFEKVFSPHVISRNILGTQKSLASIGRSDLQNYYKHAYQPERMVIAASGPLEHQNLVDLICQLGIHKKTKPPSKDYFLENTLEKISYTPIHKWISRPSEQTHMMIGLPSVNFTHPLRFESYILSSYLGGGMTAKLYQIIREQKGWAYNVYTYLQSFLEGGSLGIYIGTSPEHVPQILNVVQKELIKLKQNGISPEDLNLYKTQVTASILMGADDLDNRMNSIGINEMIYGHYRSIETVLSDIEKVSVTSFNEVLSHCLVPSQIATLCLGLPHKKSLKEFNDFQWDHF